MSGTLAGCQRARGGEATQLSLCPSDLNTEVTSVSFSRKRASSTLGSWNASVSRHKQPPRCAAWTEAPPGSTPFSPWEDFGTDAKMAKKENISPIIYTSPNRNLMDQVATETTSLPVSRLDTVSLWTTHSLSSSPWLHLLGWLLTLDKFSHPLSLAPSPGSR